MSIDWTDPAAMVTTHFNVSDCLMLPTWGRLANESDGLDDDVKANLVTLCNHMETIRQFIGNKPIQSHCAYRPAAYNELIGGAPHSAHVIGKAMDFHVVEYGGNNGCDYVRGLLVPQLQEWGVRMEDTSEKANRDWVHIDFAQPNPNRFFKP
jgi:hypothetical protein